MNVQNQDVEDTQTEHDTIHKAEPAMQTSPEKHTGYRSDMIFDSSAQQQDQQKEPGDQGQEEVAGNDQPEAKPTITIDYRLAKCSIYIDQLMHKHNSCLAKIADVREAHIFFQRKADQMKEKMREKIDQLEEAMMSNIRMKAPDDNHFLEQQLQEELNKM